VKRAEKPAGEHQEASGGNDLLATGIARYLRGAALEVAPPGYARITHRLADRVMQTAFPRELWALGGGSPSEQESMLSSLVWVDIESLGFIGRPLFLIGALYARAPGGPRRAVGARIGSPWKLEIVQYLARDYAEEETVLEAFQAESAETDLWVTYNGRSFDLPFIELRAVHHRLTPVKPRRHLDLLPVARRLWGRGLPDCRLKTIERLVMRRPRPEGDIASGRIPDAYHAFVRSGEPFDMLDVLRHNAADLTGLLDIYLLALGEQQGSRDSDPVGPARR
jgi:hypothetical protein